jgi:hypothetical protein
VALTVGADQELAFTPVLAQHQVPVGTFPAKELSSLAWVYFVGRQV